nr:retrovirus-related Pol polyprotein from transposon TNT 1-94 [Tanacetum cinerariifolium]
MIADALNLDRGIKTSLTGNRKLFSSYKAYNGDNVIFGSNLRGNIIGKGNKPKDQICLATIDENSTLWHRRLGHANMDLIQSLASKKLVRNLPKLKFDQQFGDACKIRKQAHASHKAKNIVSTTRLEFLHMDLFGPSTIRSYGGNRYTLVIVDDYSMYTWTRFLKDKTEAFDQSKYLTRKIKESLNVTFDETPPTSKTSPLVDDDLDEEEAVKVTEKKNLENEIEDETLEIDEIVNIKESIVPKNVNEALTDEKHNVDFHQIVDFVKSSHLRYALTINPTVYVSHIRQFWSTTRIETTNEETKILATVDGKPRTISESLIRRNLKLNDEEGISSLLDAEGEGSGTPTEPHHTPSPESNALPTAVDELASLLRDDC